jgi:hypothetical protein
MPLDEVLPHEPTLEELFQIAYEHDPLPNEILTIMKNRIRQSKRVSLANCTKEGNLLKYRDRIYVPDYAPIHLQLMKNHHDPPSMGHSGRSKTLELLSRNYY